MKRSVKKGKKPVELISLDLARPSHSGEPVLLRWKNVEASSTSKLPPPSRPGAHKPQRVTSEKLQNERSPNFSNFPPGFSPEFSPNFSTNFRALFARKRRPPKFTKNPRHFSIPNPQQIRESIHNFFGHFLTGEGERNGGYATFVWQERAQARATQMTHMSSLKPLSFFFVSKSRLIASSARHLLVTEKKRPPI